MRIWVVYSLPVALRHIGHLDLMRSMQRMLRRSSLPVRYSNGFNPHILLSLAAPLSVGMAGENEVMDVPLEKEVAVEACERAISEALPAGIRCVRCVRVPDDAPAAMAQVRAAEYRFDFMEEADKLFAALPAFMARESVMTVRKTKKGDKVFDLRPLVYSLYEEEGSLRASLALAPEGTAKAEIVLNELAKEAGLEKAPRAIATRVRLLSEGMTPMEEQYEHPAP